MRWYSLVFAFVACVRPPTGPEPGATSTTVGAAEAPPTKELPVRFQEDPTLNGLRMELYDATPAGSGGQRLPTPATTALSDADTQALLARLPDLPPGTEADFALREGPRPRPRTGATEQLPFGALPSDAPPADQGPLTILRRAPEGEVPLAPHVSVTFSRAMIPLTSADEAAARVPVTLEPQPKGAWRWLGTRTLLFDPEPRLPMATTYTVRVPAGTEAVDGTPMDPTSWTFATPPPALTSSAPDEYTPQRTQPLLFLGFDQAVDARALLPHLELRGADVALRVVTPEEYDPPTAARVAAHPERSVVVTPASPLPHATTFTLVVKAGAPSAEGPRVTTKDQSFRFRTYGALSLQAPTCWRTPCPPDASWSIQATNPLDPSSTDLVTLEPAVPGLVVQAGGNYLSFQGAFKPRSRYVVRVAPGVKDTFGQVTTRAYEWPIDVGAADRSFQGPDKPFVTLDPAGKPALSVFTTNHPSLRVEIRRVTPDDWKAWTEWWSRWRWDDARQGQLPGALVHSGVVTVTPQPDEKVETAIELAKHLEGGAGHFVVRVQPTVQPKNRWERSEWIGWVQVTQLGLTSYREHDAVTTWVTRLADGTAVPAATLRLLGQEGSTSTDSAGLARLPLKEALGAVVSVGKDTALLPAEPWGHYGSWTGWAQSPQARLYVFDDKHLYKPKETVHVRGWVRGWDADPETRLRSTGARRATWKAMSSLGNPLGEGTAEVTGLGGFTFDVPLPATPDLGTAMVQITVDGQPSAYVGHAFEIQEYRTPEFEVSASGADGVYALGEDAVVDVAAAYYAGGGLPNAEVTWSVSASPGSFTPPGREDWSFGAWSPWWRWWSDPEPYVAPLQHAGLTDALGQHHLGIHFAALRPARPMSVRAEATVMDTNRQAWTSGKSFLVHPAAWYVGLQLDKPYVGKGQPLDTKVVVVDREGKTVAAEATVELRRLVWRQKGGTWSEVPEVLDTKRVSGEGRATFAPPAGGSYALVATVRDAQGRPNETEVRVWVAGEALTPDRGVERAQVPILPAKKAWAVGEVATFAVQSPFVAEGLLTVHVGADIVETRPFRVTDGVVQLEVAVTEAMVPDFTVAVELVGKVERKDDQGRPRADLPPRVAYGGGTLTFDVSRQTRALGVTVTPVEARLSPGGKTEIDVTVTGPDGRPASGAELAVVAVDEAVLALTGYELPDPLAVFYGPRGNSVSVDHLRAWVSLLDPQRLVGLGATGTGEGGGGVFGGTPGVASMPAAPMAELAAAADTTVAARSRAAPAESKKNKSMDKESSESEPNMPSPDPTSAIAVRTNFSAVALWAPRVTTDTSGHARVPLALPDSLTRYRVMVVAVAGQQHFGTGTADVTARLPLMVRPSAPRFLNFGDAAEFPVVVQNQTDAPLDVRLAMRTANLPMRSAPGVRLTVPANDRVEVRFPVEATNAGTARFQVAASAGAYADAASGELPVWTPATTEAFATYGTMTGGTVLQPLVPPKDVWPQFGGLEVTTSSTQLQALTDAFLYLQTYRYECNEQLASRVMSVAALRDVLTAFDAEGLPSPEAIEATMREDLARLERRQNPDGGWAFWRRGDPSWPYLGVHVAHTLVRARDAKIEVPQGMYDRALTYARTIESHLPRWYSKEARWAIRAYAVHVLSLAGEPVPAKARALYGEAGADGLGAMGLGWVLPTLSAAKAKEAGEIRAWLGNHVTESAAGAHFVTSYSDGAHVLLHSDRVADGVLLEAMLRTTPQDDLIPKLVNGLLAHRTAGRWQSTTENAHILLALRRYFHVYEGTTPDFVARVWLGDDFVGEKRFVGRTTERAQLDVPMAWIQEHPADVTVAQEGAGRLYWRLGLRYAPKNLDVPAADRGFAVTRRYEAVDDPADVTRDGDAWIIRAGARVRVRLEMATPMRRYHVALVDPLPAGLEVMNPELAVTGSLPEDPAAAPPYWWWTRAWYDHENLRDERVEAFASLLWDGVHRYSYVARATTPGTFVVPPAKAEEMYSPETFGRSGGDRVIVR